MPTSWGEEPKNNTARFACLRGYNDRTIQDKNGKERLIKDMKDMTGSDKRFSFTVPSRSPPGKSLLVFESPVDALSQATLDKQSEIGAAWDCFQRLSLGGCSSRPLVQYLQGHPTVENITLCLDNDQAGQKATRKIYDMLQETPHPLNRKYTVNIMPPLIGKDYNDLLKINKQEQLKNEQQKISSCQRAAIFM